MMGDEVDARRRLLEGAESSVDRPLTIALCRAHLALIHAEHGRWAEAAVAARRARELLGDADSFPSTVLVIAVHAMIEAQAGHHEAADADRQLARELLTGLLGVSYWMNLQARIALARAALLRGNRGEASAMLDEAESMMPANPGAVRVAEQIAGLRREANGRDRSRGLGPSSLTTAELRVLQLLPTHLTVSQIADRLFVSRNTVKSQMIAIYRKLGATSRAIAVDIAVEAGLIR
jgi:LuxR family maltose regulon positive regulatory protein